MRSNAKYLEQNNNLNSSFASDSIDLTFKTKLSVSIKVSVTYWKSNPNGTFKIQGRNHTNENWVDITGLSEDVSGINTDILLNKSNIGFTYARVYYDRSFGGGLGVFCDIYYRVKGTTSQ